MPETHGLLATTDDPFFEVIDGQVVENAPMGNYEALVASTLLTFLNTSGVFKGLGRAMTEGLFVLAAVKGLSRRPDVAYISYERWPRRRPISRGGPWNVVPELVVEFVGPSNGANEVVGKIEEYFEAGAKLMWVSYPDYQEVLVHTSPNDVRILRTGDVLDGGVILPGFRMAVGDLFEDDLTEDE